MLVALKPKMTLRFRTSLTVCDHLVPADPFEFGSHHLERIAKMLFPKSSHQLRYWLYLLLTRQSAEVDRAYENLQKSGKGYGVGARRKPTPKASLRGGPPMYPGEKCWNRKPSVCVR